MTAKPSTSTAADPVKRKPYSKLVVEAILSLKEIDQQLDGDVAHSRKPRYKGTSFIAVSKYILEHNDFDNIGKAKGNIKRATRKLMTDNTIVHITGGGKGLTGRFKLAEKVKKTDSKKTTTKKTTAKKNHGPIKKNTKESDSDDEDSDAETESPVKKQKTVKGKLPKPKVESKVAKKTKPVIADLTKPPPKAKTTKPKEPAKTKKAAKHEADPDKENKPVKKVAKKTKVIPQVQPESSANDSDSALLITKPKNKGPAKGKGKGKKPVSVQLKTKNVYSESETDTMPED